MDPDDNRILNNDNADRVITLGGRGACSISRGRGHGGDGAVAAAAAAGGPGRALPRRGVVDRRHPRDDGRRRPRRPGPHRVPRAVEGPALGRHLRRRRPGRSIAGRVAEGEGRGPGRRRRAPAPELGRGRHRLLGGGVPGRGRGARRALLRAEGGRLHPRGDHPRRRRDRRPLRSRRPPGQLRGAARRPARRRAGWWSGETAADGLPAGAERLRLAARRATRSPGRQPVDPDAPALIGFTSGTTRNPKGVVHSHRTIGFETRQLDHMFPKGGPPQITGAPVGHFIGMLNAFLLPAAPGPAREPGRRLGPRRGPPPDVGGGPRGHGRRRHLLPDQPPRPPRLHRRAPGADALRRARRVDRAHRRHGPAHARSASRRSGPTAAPSTRRSPAACSTTPRRSA